MNGRPDNSQLVHSDLIMPEALETTDMNYAIYQISKLLKCDYGTLEDAFRQLFEKHYKAEMTYCTPLMIIECGKMHGHSVYYLTSNTLVYKHLIDGHKQALAFQSFDGHAYFYRTAGPFAGMPPPVCKDNRDGLPALSRHHQSNAFVQRHEVLARRRYPRSLYLS